MIIERPSGGDRERKNQAVENRVSSSASSRSSRRRAVEKNVDRERRASDSRPRGSRDSLDKEAAIRRSERSSKRHCRKDVLRERPSAHTPRKSSKSESANAYLHVEKLMQNAGAHDRRSHRSNSSHRELTRDLASRRKEKFAAQRPWQYSESESGSSDKSDGGARVILRSESEVSESSSWSSDSDDSFSGSSKSELSFESGGGAKSILSASDCELDTRRLKLRQSRERATAA